MSYRPHPDLTEREVTLEETILLYRSHLGLYGAEGGEGEEGEEGGED